jgi:hypothetical protein
MAKAKAPPEGGQAASIWEYTVEEWPFEEITDTIERCNQLGAEGWEMLAAGPTPNAQGTRAWFKREIIPFREA